MTPSGIEPATFRLVAQCLKQPPRAPLFYDTFHNITLPPTYTSHILAKYTMYRVLLMRATRTNILTVLYLTSKWKVNGVRQAASSLSHSQMLCSAHFCEPANLYSFARGLPQPPAFDNANTTVDA